MKDVDIATMANRLAKTNAVFPSTTFIAVVAGSVGEKNSGLIAPTVTKVNKRYTMNGIIVPNIIAFLSCDLWWKRISCASGIATKPIYAKRMTPYGRKIFDRSYDTRFDILI